MLALRRRITDTSSLNEISTNQPGNRAVMRGGNVTLTSGQIFKNDESGFFSNSDICFMSATTIVVFSNSEKTLLVVVLTQTEQK
jgi:hypothetical protein